TLALHATAIDSVRPQRPAISDRNRSVNCVLIGNESRSLISPQSHPQQYALVVLSATAPGDQHRRIFSESAQYCLTLLTLMPSCCAIPTLERPSNQRRMTSI